MSEEDATYRVATAADAGALTELVEGLIREGWKPLGGIAVAMTVDRYENPRKGHDEVDEVAIFAQAMTRSLHNANENL